MQRYGTIQQCAQAAIDMQNACNLSGVLMSWAEMRPTIWKHAKEGTTAFNVHPVNHLIAFKVYALAHGYEPDQSPSTDRDRFETAYVMCQRLVLDPDALVFESKGWDDFAQWTYKIDPGFQKQMDSLIGE